MKKEEDKSRLKKVWSLPKNRALNDFGLFSNCSLLKCTCRSNQHYNQSIFMNANKYVFNLKLIQVTDAIIFYYIFF